MVYWSAEHCDFVTCLAQQSSDYLYVGRRGRVPDKRARVSNFRQTSTMQKRLLGV